MGVSPPGDDSTTNDDGGEASPARDAAVIRDGCVRCSDREPPPEWDGALPDAPFAVDAEPGWDASWPEDGGPGPDAASSVDAASSCITGTLKCPFLALPCCTVTTATGYYGTCAPLALCR
jgi:hypothetical protein